MTGKVNKVLDVPLNVTAGETFGRYLPSVKVDSQFGFPSDRQDGPLSMRTLDHLIRKYAHLAKLNISPHDLLHRLAQIMGHDSLDTTARYTRATQWDLQAEVEEQGYRNVGR